MKRTIIIAESGAHVPHAYAPGSTRNEMAPKGWMFAPDSGGTKIPENKKREVTQCFEKFTAENYARKYVRTGCFL